ncbi:Indole-3-glycerol phosphate synthase [Galdieria sulphuraria]|uniref:indole-3-glycerol-phosphate synthase n=1 Tax=Galdieria sulphuraria TaxID=130081 RepID=M2XZW5_GALSU|nr:indole-3-glycerol phosphate synthase [Galdieria sulphuraria]EME29173.1 indole-3-glycerol phosphate synthase [Galdieria sulphuraria]GJD11454.1 Indole-3-glycerol phosphate synthase [Galdieria sulphuraria]|eukprot:XP_005705693.1 indole-3-glycerol phosphate synthase [Galdieria sulphuraria]
MKRDSDEEEEMLTCLGFVSQHVSAVGCYHRWRKHNISFCRSSSSLRYSVFIDNSKKLGKLRSLGRYSDTSPLVLKMSNSDSGEDILQSILKRKAVEVEQLKEKLANESSDNPITSRLAMEGSFEPKDTFYCALKKPNFTLSVIAEIKRKSPSKGHIGSIRDPAGLSRIYKEGGASAISVLTDLEGFGGTLDDLRKVYKAQQQYRETYPGPAPILRKDFIIDKVQIAEAAEAGASAILLIVSALGKRTKELLQATYALGLEALVEVHNEDEVDIALQSGAKIIGINNRNLKNFEVSLEHAIKLRQLLPPEIVSVAESGISDPAVAWLLRDEGFNAILVGEALVTAAERSEAVGTYYQKPVNQAYGLIRAFLSKSSRKYANSATAALWGQGEGAKEFLGSISI